MYLLYIHMNARESKEALVYLFTVSTPGYEEAECISPLFDRRIFTTAYQGAVLRVFARIRCIYICMWGY
jgi:hypothetical protein